MLMILYKKHFWITIINGHSRNQYGLTLNIKKAKFMIKSKNHKLVEHLLF